MIRWFWNLINPVVPAQSIKMRSSVGQRTLLFARQLIADKRRWTRGVEAANANGSECDPTSPEAACFCAAGAIKACAANDVAYATAMHCLASSIKPGYDHSDRPHFSAFVTITNVNDKKGHKAVLKAFDAAIKEIYDPRRHG